MSLREAWRFFSRTLRGRLIFGVAVIHAVMMTLFIIDLTQRQHALFLDHQAEDATTLAQTLASSAAVWLAANDLAGLQELVEAQRGHPEIIFTILANSEGQILAHTNDSRRGQFLADLPGAGQRTLFSKTPTLVDVAMPAFLGEHLVGWARIGLGQKELDKKLAAITLDGALYALAAILLGSLIAWRIGHHLTQRLYAVKETINRFHAGDTLARSTVSGTDEAASLAQEFNAMLDTLGRQDAELRESEQNFRLLIEYSPVAIAVTTGEKNAVQLLNQKFTELFGYDKEDIPDIDHWWSLAYPEEEYRAAVMATWSARVAAAGETKSAMKTMTARVTGKEGGQRLIEFHMAVIGPRALTTFIDITERTQAEEKLHRIEWMLSDRQEENFDDPHATLFAQEYGDLSALNRGGVILTALGRETLWEMVKEYPKLLETSAAVYERNGDYAIGIFTSRWCRMLDLAARKLCQTEDNRAALKSGQWLCHESCWTHCSQESIARKVPIDIECHGGIRLFALPIFAGEEVVGSINFGYGDPPRDPGRLREIAALYQVEYEELRQEAAAYATRPPYIIEMAKKHLQATAKLIGELVGRKRAEEELHHFNEKLEEMVKERTAAFEEKRLELERVNKLFVGRELRMVELKERIKELEARQP